MGYLPVSPKEQSNLSDSHTKKGYSLSFLLHFLHTPEIISISFARRDGALSSEVRACLFLSSFFLTRSYWSVWKSHPAKWQASLLSLSSFECKTSPCVFWLQGAKKTGWKPSNRNMYITIARLSSRFFDIYLYQYLYLENSNNEPEELTLTAKRSRWGAEC